MSADGYGETASAQEERKAMSEIQKRLNSALAMGGADGSAAKFFGKFDRDRSGTMHTAIASIMTWPLCCKAIHASPLKPGGTVTLQ